VANKCVTLLTYSITQTTGYGILEHCQEFQQLLATHNFDVICI